MKQVANILLICLIPLTGSMAQEPPACRAVGNMGNVERIETVYHIPEISPFNTLQFHDPLWGSYDPGPGIMFLTKEEQLLAVKANLKGNIEAMAQLSIPNLLYLDYMNVGLGKDVQAAIAQTIKNSTKLKVLSITDTSNTVSGLFDLNWPLNSNIEALTIKKRFVTLGPNIAKLKKLRFLSIQSPDLENLPEAIGELTELEDLEIVGNAANCIRQLAELLNITADPKGLGKIKSLPEGFKKLRKLRRLVIHSESMTVCPIQVFYCTNLIQLELYTPQLKDGISGALSIKLNNEVSGRLHNLRQLILINSVCLSRSQGYLTGTDGKRYRSAYLLSSNNLSVFLFKSKLGDVQIIDSIFPSQLTNKIVLIPDNTSIEDEPIDIPMAFKSYHKSIEIFTYGVDMTKANQLHGRMYKLFNQPILQLEGLQYQGTYLQGLVHYKKEIKVQGVLKQMPAFDIETCNIVRPLDSLFGKPIPLNAKGCIWGSGSIDFGKNASQLKTLYFGGMCNSRLLDRLQMLDSAVNLKSIMLDGVPDSILYQKYSLNNLTTAYLNTYSTSAYANKIPIKFNHGHTPNLETLEWTIGCGIQNKLYINTDYLFSSNTIRVLRLNFIKEMKTPIQVTINWGSSAWGSMDNMEFSLRGLSPSDKADITLVPSTLPYLKLDIPATFLAQLQKKQQGGTAPLCFSRELILDSCNSRADWDIPFDSAAAKAKNWVYSHHLLKKITLVGTGCTPSCLARIETIEHIRLEGVKHVDFSDSFGTDAMLKSISFKDVHSVGSLNGLGSLKGEVSLYIEDATSLLALKTALLAHPLPLNIYVDFETCKELLGMVPPIVANASSFHLYHIPKTRYLPVQIIDMVKSISMIDKPIFLDQ